MVRYLIKQKKNCKRSWTTTDTCFKLCFCWFVFKRLELAICYGQESDSFFHGDCDHLEHPSQFNSNQWDMFSVKHVARNKVHCNSKKGTIGREGGKKIVRTQKFSITIWLISAAELERKTYVTNIHVLQTI